MMTVTTKYDLHQYSYNFPNFGEQNAEIPDSSPYLGAIYKTYRQNLAEL